MAGKGEKICRLCVKTVDNECKLIDDITKEMLTELSISVDLDLTKYPILCEKCIDNLKGLYGFKIRLNAEMPAVSLHDGNYIKPESNVKSDWNSDVVDHDSFRLCLNCKNEANKNYILTNTLFQNTEYPQLMLTFISVKESSISKKSIICISCKDKLERYLKFVQKCLKIEEKIHMYCLEKESTDAIKLIDFQNYLLKYTPELNDAVELNKVKQELDMSDSDSYEYPLERYNGLEDETQGSIKEEINKKFAAEDINLKTENYQPQNSAVKDEFECRLCMKKVCKTLCNRKYICETCQYTANSGRAFQSHLLSHHFTLDGKTVKCTKCSFQTQVKQLIFSHLLVHSDSLDVTTYKCTLCPFRSFFKQTIRSHLESHRRKNVAYKCESCEYKTKTEAMLKNHMLSHTSANGVYNCDKCPYKTMLKRYYNRHVSRHNKNVSDMLKCSICSFQTAHRKTFDKHRMTHVKIVEKDRFKCEICSFETLKRRNLKRHVDFMHGDVSKLKLYKCSNCPYETKYKSCLSVHTLVHKERSEMEIFKCFNCPYETVKKCNLRRHMLMHMDKANTNIYKCTTCPYVTKYKSDISRHQIVHQNDSDAQKFKCSFCDYESKWRSMVKSHLRTHAT